MAGKLAQYKGWLILGTVILFAIMLIARVYLSLRMIDIPLFASEYRLRSEANEMQSVIDSLYTEANEISTDKIVPALADHYLSREEENTTPAKTMEEIEFLNIGLKYPALREGFTFKLGYNKSIEVKGFSFTLEDAKKKLEEAFEQKGTAVKESVLLLRVDDLLRQNTQYDGWLDDKEKAIVSQIATTPEFGKKAALSRGLATSAIDQYCQKNKLLLGNEPPEKIFLNNLIAEYTPTDKILGNKEMVELLRIVTVEEKGKRFAIRENLAKDWIKEYCREKNIIIQSY